MSVNKVILVGRLGDNPSVKTFQNGGKIATCSLATSERWTDKQTGERKEHTEWHNIVFNGRLADIAEQYLAKGSKIYVDGSIHTRQYQDKQGNNRYITEIKVTNLQMLDDKPQGQQQPQQGYQQPRQQPNRQQQRYAQQPQVDEDDIPF